MPSQLRKRDILIHIYLLPVLIAFTENILLYFLCSLLEKIEQETWRETGISFVTSVTRLVERLLDYRCAEIELHIMALMVYIMQLQSNENFFFFLCLGTA